MKKNLPVIIAVIVAIAVSYLYFSSVLSGKRLAEHDRLTALGAQKEAVDYYNKTGEITQWSNSMFGGMPTVTFWAKSKGNIAKTFHKIERIGVYPASYLTILILGSFLCLILFGVNPWISILGALLYAFASHNFILIWAGHITKLWALAYLPPLIGSIYYTFTKNKIWGALLTTLFLSLEISAIHPQILYYGFIVVLLFGVVGLIYAFKAKETKEFFIKAAYLVAPLIIALGMNANYLISTQEYSKFSTRGTNELSIDSNKGKSGLSKDYILDYSYDVSEALTAFIPRLKGGSMSEPLGENSKLYKELSKSQGEQQTKKMLSQGLPLYWGSQPIVSGPFYFGALTIFLFVLGLFVVKGREKWWLVSVVALSFLLSLGRYFSAFNNLIIDILPLYNKFRDVKNIVFIQCLGMWLLGLLALKEMFQDKLLSEKKHFDGLKYSTIITGGIALILALIPTIAGSFTGTVDSQLASSGWPAQLVDLLREDRISIARIDAFRSLIFVLLGASVLWFTLKKKLNVKYALIIASVLVLADLWPVNKRYISDENFVSKRQAENPFTPTKADQFILNDKSLDYRVLNITANPFSDGTTSYFHKSIGGYSGAKLYRYQDLIEHGISGDIQKLRGRLQGVKSQADVDEVFSGLNTLNMLNAKYVIYNAEATPLTNGKVLGNAWFAPNVKLVANAKEEIESIEKVAIENTAIVHKQFGEFVSGKNFSNDPTASISLKSYVPNKLVYQSNTSTEQLAVFSEIYYPKGWTAKIDGKVTPYFRANYVLRSLVVPAGSHEITFEFKPKSYVIGNTISLISSIIFILALALILFIEFKKSKKMDVNAK